MPEDSDDEVDRLFTFEVAKTKEEQENVTPLPGFEVGGLLILMFSSHANLTWFMQVRNLPIEEIQVPDDPDITPEIVAPQLVAGETGIGFMTAAYESAKNSQYDKSETHNAVSLNSLMYVLGQSMTVLQLMNAWVVRKDRSVCRSPFQSLPCRF